MVNKIKVYKPTSAGRRNSSVIDYKSVLTANTTPEKSLLEPLKKQGGRNNTGMITVRHRGGGHKRHYRVIDFLRNKDNIPARVSTIEYDPNRTAFIALVVYADGTKKYILATQDMKVGQTIMSGEKAEIRDGNAKQLQDMPEGTFVHNIEITPGKGGTLIRSAGTSAQVMGRDESGRYVIVRLMSGEMRKVLATNKATIGTLSNPAHINERIGKAGRSRYLGIRPTVRGSVMNPIDHPHGGGEGRTPIGRPSPMSAYGKRTRGIQTRNKSKHSSKLIVRTRRAKG